MYAYKVARLGRGRRSDEARREGFARHLERFCLRQPVGWWWSHPGQLEPHLVSHHFFNEALCDSVLTSAQRGRAPEDQLSGP